MMPKRILTVDDSKTMRDMLLVTLKKAGYDVVQAEDGKDGLEKLQDNGVDVIITDINMPVMDGITFIRECRAQAAYAATPILTLTTESSDAKKAEGRAAGATGWIVKPFNPEGLIRVVEKVCP
jgi:two-component system chemotaxis response regulator CheY